MDTGEAIFEKNASQKLEPASLTKIMTCILALENTADLDNEMVIYPQSIQDYLYTYSRDYGAVSLGGLIAGEELAMRKLLYAMMLPSANEAALIVAEHIAGSQEAFADMMNRRARELGAKNTNFVTPNGLHHPEHVTTAEDMAIIALHALSIPEFASIVTTDIYDSGPTNKHENLRWENTNLMQLEENSFYYPGLSGVKTGTTPQAGRCFISTATRDGFSYLLVVMGSDFYDGEGEVIDGNMAFRDTAMFYNWAFGSFRVKNLIQKGRYVAEIPVRLSTERDAIRIMTADAFSALVYYEEDASKIRLEFDIPDYVEAPVKRFDKIGTARIILSGKDMGEMELLAADTVDASRILILWESMKGVLASFWFKYAIVFTVLSVITYTFVMITHNRRRRRLKGGGKYRPRRRM
ncbi:MAG: D-alanyl-D-alanine carboxypeptidase [Oscillospiraceae bacterium]|nr:D-alanyl-D-alanine carboxypeptidase [Oscillospiraceae bacterium]